MVNELLARLRMFGQSPDAQRLKKVVASGQVIMRKARDGEVEAVCRPKDSYVELFLDGTGVTGSRITTDRDHPTTAELFRNRRRALKLFLVSLPPST